MNLNIKNNLNEKSIFWLAQLICLIAQVGYCSSIIQHPLSFSTLNTPSRLLTEAGLTVLNMYLPHFALLNLILSLLVFPFLEKRLARIIYFLLNTSIIYLLYKHQPGHNMHMLFWVLFYGCLLPTNNFLEMQATAQLKSYIQIMQIQILLIYSISGLWKLYYFFYSSIDDNLSAGANFLAYAVAQEYINTGHVSLFSQSIIENTFMMKILSLSALCIQIFCMFVMFRPRLYPIWGLLLALFHVGTLAIMNVFFIWPIFITIIFLTLSPTIISSDLKLFSSAPR